MWAGVKEALHALVAALVSLACADTLVGQGDLFNGPCLKLTLSKALGYGVVLGATIVKVPQIVKIMRSGSAQGVSLVAHLIELAVYTISVTRSYNLQLPFSTWGESFFVTVQLLILVACILYFSKRTAAGFPVYLLWSIVTAAFLGFLEPLDPRLVVKPEMHSNLQQYVGIPLNAVGRLMQILTIIQEGATGQLSVITTFLNFAGAWARVFTTLQEVDDQVILLSFLVGAGLNTVLVLLFALYPSKAAADAKKAKKTKKTQ